jgi:hypothetical protein
MVKKIKCFIKGTRKKLGKIWVNGGTRRIIIKENEKGEE